MDNYNFERIRIETAQKIYCALVSMRVQESNRSIEEFSEELDYIKYPFSDEFFIAIEAADEFVEGIEDKLEYEERHADKEAKKGGEDGKA